MNRIRFFCLVYIYTVLGYRDYLLRNFVHGYYISFLESAVVMLLVITGIYCMLCVYKIIKILKFSRFFSFCLVWLAFKNHKLAFQDMSVFKFVKWPPFWNGFSEFYKLMSLTDMLWFKNPCAVTLLLKFMSIQITFRRYHPGQTQTKKHFFR